MDCVDHGRTSSAATFSPRLNLVHWVFELQASLTPSAIALEDLNARLTYSELNYRSNQLARFLISRSVGPDQIIAICLERSINMVVALLGVLKAGGAYLPIDPGYPPDRIQYMLRDARPRLVLTEQTLLARLSPFTT